MEEEGRGEGEGDVLYSNEIESRRRRVTREEEGEAARQLGSEHCGHIHLAHNSQMVMRCQNGITTATATATSTASSTAQAQDDSSKPNTNLKLTQHEPTARGPRMLYASWLQIECSRRVWTMEKPEIGRGNV